MSTTTEYTVSGMTCSHCVQAVTEEVSALAGVTQVTVDLTSGGLKVVSDSPVPRAESELSMRPATPSQPDLPHDADLRAQATSRVVPAR